MNTSHAVIIAGLVIAIFSGGAIVHINRYEVTQPLSPELFTRYDRWTGQVERCSSIYDGRTYCGSELKRRVDRAVKAEHAQAVKAQHANANLTFRTLGYTQEQIDNWPKSVLEQARNLVGNRADDEKVAKYLEGQNLSPPNPANKPTADEFLGVIQRK